MNITFVLPAYAINPIGGFKIVYEYANRLQARGHQVTIVYPRDCRPKTSWREYVKILLWLKGKLCDKRSPSWFTLLPGVTSLFVPTLADHYLPDADAIITTGWPTVPWIANASTTKGRKFNLIQHYETWDGDKAGVEATWRLPLHKIVIAKWLQEIAEGFGEQARTTYIPNSIDFSKLGITRPIEQRNPKHIGMLYHRQTWKGSSDGLKALMLLRERHPDLKATLFGVPFRPRALPDWITYIHQPSPEELRDIYNACAIFIQTSHTEGWGLAATEAMACGCALVTYDNGGSRDYALDGETALVTPAQEPEAVAERVHRLIENQEHRLCLAHAGCAYIQQFNWPQAVSALEALLQGQG